MTAATLSSTIPSGIATQRTDTVDPAQVRGAAPSDAQAAAGFMFGTFAYRHDWGDAHGGQILTLNWDVVGPSSLVYVAIGEGAAGGGKFVGLAKYTLHNVAPNHGQVTIWLDIDWESPIRLLADYYVVNV